MGHNSGTTGDELRSAIERIERLNDERASLAADVREIMLELKGKGFNVAAVREVLRRRKMDCEKLEALDADVPLYLGQLEGTPLGDAAMERAA